MDEKKITIIPTKGRLDRAYRIRRRGYVLRVREGIGYLSLHRIVRFFVWPRPINST